MKITPLTASPKACAMLSEILIETVANGGSVSFMHPLAPETAESFWNAALAAAGEGKRIVLGAWDGDVLAGTVTLLVDCPPNQPHRAEIAKMMTRLSHRGRGIASALLREAEALAIKRGRTLLVLDTASDGGASGLYEKQGFTFAGEIPGYALKPHGGLTGTRIYWKVIGNASGGWHGRRTASGPIGRNTETAGAGGRCPRAAHGGARANAAAALRSGTAQP